MTLYPHDGTETINVGTSTANATPINGKQVHGARILVPHDSPLDDLEVTFFERPMGTEDWFACDDENDTAIAFTASEGRSRPFPYSLHAGHEFCLVASGLGDPTPILLVSKEAQERP